MTRLTEAFFAQPIAHRGLHDAKGGVLENSLGAVRAAVAAGYGIEVDLQPSSDNQAMVFHDATLDRLTGETGRIDGVPARNLAEISLTGTDETIPTFAAMLELVAGRVPLVIELKDQDGGLGPDFGELHLATAELIRGYDGPIAVMSFNALMIEAFAKVLPDCPIGLITCAFTTDYWPDVSKARREILAAIETADQIEIDFISHQVADLGMARVAELKAQGLPIFCWTTRSLEDDALARRVADNVTFEGYTPNP